MTHAALQSVRLESECLDVRVVPEIGAKIVSLRDKGTGREWMWTDPSRPLRRAQAGHKFADYDISGMDECFPTIGACTYPDGEYAGRDLPDHGEVWTAPWRWRVNGTALETAVDGNILPYRLTRTARVVGATLHLDYELTNRGLAPLKYQWSAHPLFAIDPGMQIQLPGTAQLIKEFGLGGLVGADEPGGLQGYLGEARWPYVKTATGGVADLRILDFPQPPATYKVYAVDLTAGWARLVDPSSAQAIEVRWGLDQVCYLGICVNMAAWPETGSPGRWIAIEPCTATCDRLDLAAERGECATVAGGGSTSWWMEIEAIGGLSSAPRAKAN